MKNANPSIILAAVLFLAPVTTVWTQSATPTKKAWTGNQLTGGVPKTQRPAETVGPVKDWKAVAGTSALVLQKGSVLYLKGDSTLHKFEMGAKTLTGSAAVKAADLKGNGALEKAVKAGSLAVMTLEIPVDQLKSKEKGLDENAYKALKAKEYPAIQFALDSLAVAKNEMTAKGKLTIAGTTLPVTLTGTASFLGKQVQVKGSTKLKMSDYKVTPPSISILVTSINVMDEVEVVYDVLFAPKD